MAPKKDLGSKKKILAYFMANVGKVLHYKNLKKKDLFTIRIRELQWKRTLKPKDVRKNAQRQCQFRSRSLKRLRDWSM